MHPSKTPLEAIAHARSGDKGNHANIAVFAYTQEGYAWLHEHLTSELVGRYFAALNPSRVIRYEAANLLGFNFVLYDLLAGGASRSLRVDSQGKTLALALLQMEIAPAIDKRRSMLRRKPKGKEKPIKVTAQKLRDTAQKVLDLLDPRSNPKRRKKHDRGTGPI